jgi:FHA domain
MAQAGTTRPITGDDIISELIRNVEAGAFKVRYTTLVPCVFNVYLHADDYEQIRPIAGFVRSEARQALDEHLARLNRGGSLPSVTKWLGIGSNRQPEFKALNAEWTIEFHRDEEERLRRGDIEIYSELGSSEHEELGAGAKTTFITRRPLEASPQEPMSTSEAPTETIAAQPRTERKAYAYLRYTGPAGPTTFPITRDQTVIGRGGKSFWVDLKLEGPADISREHCRIRRDPASGKFSIKDVSQYGTSVDGQSIPTSLERAADGAKVDRNIEAALPLRAKIGLADVFFLDFEAVQPE